MGDQPASTSLWSVAALATEGVDQLSARLQHLDAGGYGLKELVSPSGCLFKLQQHMWALLNPWSSDTRHSHKLWATLEHQHAIMGEVFNMQEFTTIAEGTC